MGDVLHALPAVIALRRLTPEMEIDWVVDPRWAPLLTNAAGSGPAVSAVKLAETKMWSQAPLSTGTLHSVLGLQRELRAARYGCVVDMQGTLRSAVIGWMAGGKKVDFAGFKDPREPAAGLLYRRRLARWGTHVAEQNAALLGGALGLEILPSKVELPLGDEAEAWADRALHRVAARRFALLAPTAGWEAKQWPAERFGALALALRDRGIAALVNAPEASDRVGAAVVRASTGAAEVVPSNVAQLVALTRRAAVVVGGDSGPVHLAAALGRPLVALYGPTDPARNGPWGSGPMRVLRDPRSMTSYKRTGGTEPGLARIDMEAVLAAIEAVTV